MRKNENLNRAKRVKNDEFYTRYEDIAKELNHWRDKFKDKIVYCPCDNFDSNFFKYFRDNFYDFGLKKLICTSLTGDRIEIDRDNGFSIYSDSCLDMFSEESLEIMREADMVVTNPPFSKSRKYVDILMAEEKDFILLGNLNWATSLSHTEYIVHKKMFPGYESGKFRFAGGEELNNILWWSTFSDAVWRKPLLELEKSIYKEKYEFYSDRPEIINVDRVKDIPKDWDGLMGVPVSIINKINYSQFEIVDCIRPHIGDRTCYQRLVIRKLYNKESI